MENSCSAVNEEESTDVLVIEPEPQEGDRRTRAIPGAFTYDTVSELYTQGKWILDGVCKSELDGMETGFSTYTSTRTEVYKLGVLVSTHEFTEYDRDCHENNSDDD